MDEAIHMICLNRETLTRGKCALRLIENRSTSAGDRHFQPARWMGETAMQFNRDADDLPELSQAMIARAVQQNMHPVAVTLEEPGAIEDDPSLEFYALMSFIPRSGDRIVLENGRVCEVERVYYQIHRNADAAGANETITLTPTVVAVAVDNI
jgi:hypothetical protein